MFAHTTRTSIRRAALALAAAASLAVPAAAGAANPQPDPPAIDALPSWWLRADTVAKPTLVDPAVVVPTPWPY